jgi:hypothetical protein
MNLMLREFRFVGRAVLPRPPGGTDDERGGLDECGGLGETALPKKLFRVTSG